MLNNLLLYRILIVNVCGAAILVWAGLQGYIREIYTEDSSHISMVIVVLFLVGLWSVHTRAGKVSKSLNELKAGRKVDVDAVKFLAKGEHINDIANWLVTLGLIGTVVGIIMALSSIDPNTMASATGVQTAIGHLIGGMKVAVYTTLVGAYFGLWLEINRRVLTTATILMIEDARKA